MLLVSYFRTYKKVIIVYKMHHKLINFINLWKNDKNGIRISTPPYRFETFITETVKQFTLHSVCFSFHVSEMHTHFYG